MDDFNEMLRSWQTFYFTMGGASATLVGLMIVALSLGTNLINDETRADVEHFATPSVFYFISILVISGTMLVPSYTPTTLALLLFLGGTFGFMRTLRYVQGLIRAAQQHQDFEFADWLAQIMMPLTGYSLILLTALGLVVTQWTLAFTGLWLATLILMICGIANTWSMVLWIIEHREK